MATRVPRKRIRAAALAALAAGLFSILAGCSGLPGRIYTNVVLPESTDFQNTPVGSKRCVLNEHQIKVPVDRQSVTAEWTTGLIQAASKEAGITRITYTEQEILSVLFGLYTRRRLIIHGD
ncbi:MAG: TRL domain-containing protein [Planctomycetota bacterium]